MAESLAFREPACPEFDGAVSCGILSVEFGTPITSWTGGTTATDTAAQPTLEILANQDVVIGRQEGGWNEYLDPQYRPTQIVPQTGQSVLTQYGNEADR